MNRIIDFASKLLPRVRHLSVLVKPHLNSLLRDPIVLKAKLVALVYAWRTGGFRQVVQRLQLSDGFRNFTLHPGQTKLAVEFMAKLTATAPTRRVAREEPLPGRRVSVIIPVYRGVTETRRCIESILQSVDDSSCEVILINDCSPEPEIDALLDSYADRNLNLKILKNETNLGFVRTVNRGMRLAGEADVILLNSDTEVAADWVSRLRSQAYAEDSIGTVTPFSNNATICNYPDIDGWPELPEGETTQSIDRAFSGANAGWAVDIPTGVGFCMYIKRGCLNDVGLFDEEAFGRGYGEENDFCLRAANKGWRNVLATDVFVFHEGEISFSESAVSGKARAMEVIRERYPNYEEMVSAHVRNDPAYPYRLRATAERYRLGDRPVVLFVTHLFGGGTERHVRELADAISSKAKVLFLRPSRGQDGSDVLLEAHDKFDRLSVGLSSQNIELLAKVLCAYGVSKVHVHHTFGFDFLVEDLLSLIGSPYDVTAHDFYPICPRINLRRPKKGYCGSPKIGDCKECLSLDHKFDGVDIVWWRAHFESLFNGAKNVYCPSADTAGRIAEFFSAAPVRIVPHENIELPAARYAEPRVKRRIAILGVLAEHKGLDVVQDMLTLIDKNKLAMEIVLIGYPEKRLKNSRSLTQTGQYDDSELAGLIEKYDPELIFFPATCPETYSYTLSAALLSGRPIVVADLGALPERIRGKPNGFVVPHNLPASELTRYLMQLNLRKPRVAVDGKRCHVHAE